MFHLESAGAGVKYCDDHKQRPSVEVTGPYLPNHCLATSSQLTDSNFIEDNEVPNLRRCILIGNRTFVSINFASPETHCPSHLCNRCDHVTVLPSGSSKRYCLSDLVSVT